MTRARALLALMLAASGCDRIEGELPSAVAIEGSGSMRAGVARVDITPIPGFPMGGHAFEAQVAVGVWTHLYANVIYVEDPNGTPLVLVACDLWAIPAGLVDAVSRALHDHAETRHIGREHLVVGATHTHHSPGNYSSSRIYNRHASALPGFDPDLHAFLVDRLVGAIREAVASREPATLRHGERAVEGVARNRSIEPFLQNPEAEEWLRGRADAPGCGTAGSGADLCRAVDPTMQVIVIAPPDAPDDVRGVAGFFAVHATTMPNFAEVYHGDLFGIATATASARLGRGGERPVIALFNGAQGDVSPNWEEQGFGDTVALGRALGDGLSTTIRLAALPLDGEVQVSHRVERLANRATVTAAGSAAHASRRAVSGLSQIGGAEDGRTLFHRLGIREGHTTESPVLAGQGPKQPVIALPLVLLGLPTTTVPDHVPLTVASVGPARIATLPGEFTTVLGARIRQEIATQTKANGPIMLAGLAGEYLSYFTTPEEYDLQHYEGASMLYGRDAGTVVQALIGTGAATSPGSARGPFTYAPGHVRRFGFVRDRVARRLTTGASDRVDAQTGDTHGPTMRFETRPPRWPKTGDTAPIVPAVTLELRGPDGSWATPGDGTADLRTVLVVVDVTNVAWAWEARLIEGSGMDGTVAPLPEGSPVRLRVSTPDGPDRCSGALTPGENPPGPCD